MSEHPWAKAARRALNESIAFAVAAIALAFAVAIVPPFPLDGLLAGLDHTPTVVVHAGARS